MRVLLTPRLCTSTQPTSSGISRFRACTLRRQSTCEFELVGRKVWSSATTVSKVSRKVSSALKSGSNWTPSHYRTCAEPSTVRFPWENAINDCAPRRLCLGALCSFVRLCVRPQSPKVANSSGRGRSSRTGCRSPASWRRWTCRPFREFRTGEIAAAPGCERFRA